MILILIRKGWLYLFLWNFADILIMKHCVGLFNDWSVTTLRFLMKNANLAVLIINIDVLVSYHSLSVAPSPICIFFYSCLSHLFWPQIMVTIDTVPSKMNCTVIDMANKVRPKKYVYFFFFESIVNVCKFSESHFIYLQYLVVHILIYKVK